MARYFYGDQGGVVRNDYKRATKTKRRWWFDYWESWEMFGIQGDDTLIGGPKDDSLYGGTGNDSLRGEGGNDYLDGNGGYDTMVGGTGNDTYRVDSTRDRIFEYSGGGTDTVHSVASYYRLPNYVENLILDGGYSGYGNSLSNRIEGNNNNNFLMGYGGDDRIEGMGGNDTIDGGTGRDTMIGGSGNDDYYVESAGDVVTESFIGGIDRVISSVSGYRLPNYVENLKLSVAGYGYGNSLRNIITGSDGADFLKSSNGSDTIMGEGGADQLFGELGYDSLLGGAGNDTLYGGSDRDTLSGGLNDDQLYGGSHSDVLYGDSGDDLLHGYGHTSSEFDTLTGGSGADRFALGDLANPFYEGLGQATIADFNRAEGDKIVVSGSLEDYTLDLATPLGSNTLDTRILLDGDVIGIVTNRTDLTLGTDMVTVVGLI